MPSETTAWRNSVSKVFPGAAVTGTVFLRDVVEQEGGSMSNAHRVLIVGAGIGGLTLALQLHEAGIGCRIVEAAPDLAPLGVGINILPHASAELFRLGLGEALEHTAVCTREASFFNRFGQHIYSEPAGRDAGYAHPQLSVHRGDLQLILVSAVRDRLGTDAIVTGQKCVRVGHGDGSALAYTEDEDGAVTQWEADVVVGCDGVHSAVRRCLHSDEGPPRYSGCMMWRGATVTPPFLSGASMVRVGWLSTGKMVIYPIRDDVDGRGNQLVNWVAELESPQRSQRSWTRTGTQDDFAAAFADWRFDWLDVPALIDSTDTILEYPMVDQEPLPWWGEGRVTLLGDAAHPMVPRGANGAGQAILDTRALTQCLCEYHDPTEALRQYEDQRREATARVVHMNRTNPPDAVLREVYERTGDRPFATVEAVITTEEIEGILGRYRSVTGSSTEALQSSGETSP